MSAAEQQSGKLFLRGQRMAWFAALVWSILIGLSYFWNTHNEQARFIELARVQARTNLGKDKAFRLWATAKGGFYIPVSEHSRPSPYLAHVPLRDVKTTTGMTMTLLNPATVIKEVGEQFQELSGVQARITNNVYLNPDNAPDQWEIAALERFRKGEQEVFEITAVDGKDYLRLSQPMRVEPGCLKCHSGIVGDVGGSTGVSIPLERYQKLAHETVVNLAQTHGGIWCAGLGLIGFIGRRSRKYEIERASAEFELRKLSRAMAVSASAIMIMNADEEIQYVNEKFCAVTGYRPDEVIGRPAGMLKPDAADQALRIGILATLRAGKEWKGEMTNRKKDGTQMYCLESISGIAGDDGNITHFVAVMEDISARKQAEETIMQLAYFDPLTELPNRRNFYERLKQMVAHCRRAGSEMALLYIDLDSFKSVNDNLGHAAGDEFLKVMAHRLSSCMKRETDVVARLGGDEFAILVADTSREAVALVADKLIHASRLPLMLGGKELQPSISMGISMFPEDSSNLDELVKYADIALYKAKDAGKNTFCFYS
ncbi:MAG TPA: diguanylate cyclase [Gallionellaceae bacterium]|nr:diguanylate cyclase [Gallionellaceae bacterium]